MVYLKHVKLLCSWDIPFWSGTLKMKSVKNSLNEKNLYHGIVEVKRVQARLRKKIKEAKSLYKQTIEFKQFSNGNLKEVLVGVQTLTGQHTTPAKNVSLSGRDLETLAEEFNEFYTHFGKHDFSQFRSEISQVKTDLGKLVADGVVF